MSVLVLALLFQRLEGFLGTVDSTSYQSLGTFPTYVTVLRGGFSYPRQLRMPPGIAIAPVGLS